MKLDKATVILGKTDICKDCMKTDVCKHKANLDKDPIIGMFVEQCEYFKDKSKLIELPCKVGDTVYFVDYSIIVPTVVKCFETNDHGWCVRCDDSLLISTLIFRFDEFGKTVFLTTEEAEKAFAERSTE